MRNIPVILLAGGVGSRLNILVKHRAKPAVPFGGMYRIIDFTLSNIVNSGFARVAVLTQYKPLSLMDHVGDGSAWDLAGRSRSVQILPPKTGEKDWDWYQGTADAVRQNLSFIASGDHEEVLVLSGDHIYMMDYRRMIQAHRERKAQVTIGMITVPWEETRHFGTAVVDGQDRILDWEEKSPNARSNLASMGIYVFDRRHLIKALQETRELDFGHHIIPRSIEEAKVFAYLFNGYWKDVGTLQAYWDSNMDLLNPLSGLSPQVWQTMTNHEAKAPPHDRPPARIGPEAKVTDSVISAGCVIQGTVEHSVLSPGVTVGQGSVVRHSVIMHDATIQDGASLERAIVDKEAFIGEGALAGQGNPALPNEAFPGHLYSGLTVIGKRARVPSGIRVGTNVIVHPDVSEADFTTTAVRDGCTVEPSHQSP